MREMKDSGIDYIGNIPKTWTLTKIKFCADIFGRIGFRGYTEQDLVDYEEDGAITLSPSNFHDMKMDYKKCTYLSWRKYEESPEIMIKNGDVLLVKTGSTYGKAVYVTDLPKEATINPQLIVFKNIKTDSKLFSYILQTKMIKIQTELAVVGGTIPTMSQEKIYNFILPEIPESEQQKILICIDKECDALDCLISDIQSQIEALEEYKRSVITEAVTKGLDPDVEMRDSGIEWLGFIPSTWQTRKGKYIFVQRNERGNSIELQLLSPTQKYGVIPQDLYEEISGYKAVKLDEKTDYSLLKTIHKGDYCISLRSFQGGFEYSEYEGVVSPAYQVFYPVIEVFRGYYKHLFKTQIFIDKMNSFTMSLRDGKNIAFADFGNTYLPIPPIQEQQQITDYLDSKCSEIDSIIAEKKQQIETIAWLAYRLATLHDADNKIIFDNVIIMTDRVVVDRQLQKAIMGMEHKSGLIRVMDEKCNSADLAIALNGNTKIIATTIQKFPYIVDSVQGLKNKRFAVIIDEAHSSTAGKDMAAVTQSLGMGDELYQDMEDEIAAELARNGKQQNVSMFAFTATPKPTTLQLFGTINPNGHREAFHVYSMKQAIEEGFILDVLQNYTTYKTFYQINKEIEEDPKMQTASAKRQIARFVELHETNIAQRIEVIVEHFRTTVMQELGGQAKAMVITASRQAAVKYCQAFEDYCSKKGYKGIRALVAFSGKVKLPDDDTEYTEPGINGIPEDQLTKEFDKDDYQVLLVANKYQTGFDQPKLCAMYIMKKLKGVNAVQTLSRLNRICPPFEKKTFILDFVNSYEDIVGAFAPYYTTTLLSNSVTPTAIYDLEAQIDAYAIIDPEDVDKVNEILYKEKVQSADKKKINFCLDKSQKLIEHYSIEKQREIVVDLRHFVRFYEFMIQVSSFEDTELHKKYNYIILLLSHINIKHPGPGFNLDGKIRATQFVQKKQGEHTESDIVAKPVVKLPSAETFGLTPAKEERLSEIIAAINARTGKSYDSDVAVKAMLQIRDILMKSDKLKASAKNNTVKDFEFSYFDDIDDALIEGLEQNQDFFSLLLNDEEIKREVLGIFTEEIYNSLKKAAEE